MYFTQDDIAAEMPPEFLLEALDDDADGVIDAGLWDKVVASASRKVDAALGQRFTVPFTGTIPALVKEAAIVFCLETLYRRRGFGEEETNPWITLANSVRKKLTRIGNGEEPLTPTVKKPTPSVSTVTEPARTTSSRGYISA